MERRIMANLDRLIVLKGAVTAGEFTPNGELVSHKGDLTEEVARLIAKMCAANTMMGISQAESFTKISGMKWLPFHGWAVAAGDYSVCVVGNIGVFVETAKADFNDIFKTLSEEAHVTLRAA
jgi:roadblock/LC7 domain-containing protein